MPNITKITSLLDTLRGNAARGDRNHDASYLLTLHNSYEALRQAALDGERYRKAAEALAKAVSNIDAKIGLPPMYEPRETNAFKNGWNSNDDKWSKERSKALEAYRQAIEH